MKDIPPVRHHLRQLGLLVILAPVVAACDVRVGDKGVSVDIAEGKAVDSWERQYTLAPGGRLDIINLNGPITITPASGTHVDVRAERQARARSDEAAQALLSETTIVDESSPGAVRIETGGSGGRRGFGFGRNTVNVEYTVRVPAGLQISARTENGAVRLERVDGRLDAATTNGGITGREISGSLKAATVNGGVQVGFAAVRGEVELTTVNGGIRVELPADIDADLQATAVNGGVNVDEALRLKATERSRNRVTGAVNNGGPRILVQATNGGVRVTAGGAASSASR